MIACAEVLDEDQLLDDLPGAPLEEEDCPYCQGHGGHISLHPLYAGIDYCGNCNATGTFLVEAKGDSNG
jgi:hypothetical protein